MQIAVLSDTHGLLRPEVIHRIQGVDAILHAGDVGRDGLLGELRDVAPTFAIRGNIDKPPLADELPPYRSLAFEGRSLFLIHDLADLRPKRLPPETEIVVFGHSHKPDAFTRDGLSYLNPGSIGPRRFKLPISFALLDCDASGFRHRFVEIPPHP